jgi:DNA-binding transcriptional MerR regulator
MQQIAQLAEQIRHQRQPTTPDNPLLQVQAMLSDGIIAALNGYRDLRDRSVEQIFLALYSAPLLQALVGLRASDEPPRRHPGLEPEQIAFVQQRIAELKARLAEGGLREATIRGLVYIGLAGPGVDERAFEVLRQMRAAGQGEGMTLEEFKQMLREQFFALLLDRDGALAAIPQMLPADAVARADALGKIRQVVSAVGEVSGERAERLAQIEKLFQAA